MTTTIVYGDGSDGYVVSSSAVYSTARAGGTLVADTAAAVYGQQFSGGTYGIVQSFHRFAYTAPAGELISSAGFRFYHGTVLSPGVVRDMEVFGFDWGTSVTTADFRSSTALASLPRYATVKAANQAMTKFTYAGSDDLLDQLAAGTQDLRVVAVSNDARTGAPPTGTETTTLAASEEAGTTRDPALVFTSIPVTRLYGVLGAQVKLSGGTWALIESDGAGNVTLKHASSSGTVSTISTLSGFRATAGPAALSLAVDASDNLYVCGPDLTQPNRILITSYVKGSGLTWTFGGGTFVPLPAHAGRPNATALAWHSTGGTGGTLIAFASHSAGEALPGVDPNDIAAVTVDALALRTGAQPAPRSTQGIAGVMTPATLPAGWHGIVANESGNGLDAVALSANFGQLAIIEPAVPGTGARGHLVRYTINSAGAVSGTSGTSGAWGVKDAGAKVRIAPLDSTTIVVATADGSLNRGITVQVYQVTGSGWTALGPAVPLAPEGITGMPAPSALVTSSAWDLVITSHERKAWVYFTDPAIPRTVRRTGINLDTSTATRESISVATVGTAGGSVQSIRAQRGARVGSASLLTFGYRDSGGTHSTLYHLDSFNVAPLAPTLTTRASYDATQAATYAWTHNDPNAGEAQSAYQLQIINASTQAVVLDTGKVVSATQSRSVAGGTLTNGNSYQWRVRTYDTADQVSPWSTYGSFQTSASGIVTITAPATDNEPWARDDYTVQWTVTGATQASYRIWVTRNDTGAIVYDWLGLVATSRNVTGLVSDVEHTIRVEAKDAANVPSNTATRLITPSYATPETPIVSATPNGPGGYVLVSVTNPVNAGNDRPAVVRNDVYRRVGSGEYELIGSCGPSGEFRDYGARAMIALEYKVRAVTA